MALFSIVARSCPLTHEDISAIEAVEPRLPSQALPFRRLRAGDVVELTLGQWAVLSASYSSSSQFYHRVRLAPYAIPAPFTKWQHPVAPYASFIDCPTGLYFVSDRPPVLASVFGSYYAGITVGHLVTVTPSSSDPTVSVTLASGETVVVPIPRNVGAGYMTAIETPYSVVSVAASGCLATTQNLFFPPGIFIDPDPGNWLGGYSPADNPLPVGSVPAMVGPRPFVYRRHGPGATDDLVTSNERGLAGLPKMVGMQSYPPGVSLINPSTYRPWFVCHGGNLAMQGCGFDLPTSPWAYAMGGGISCATAFYQDASNSVAAILSVPSAVHLWTTGSGGTATATLHRQLLDGSGSTIVGTWTVSAAGMESHTLSEPIGRYVYWWTTSSSGLTVYPACVPSVNHALPFSVVASDGTVIPAGIAPAHLSAVAPAAAVAGSLGTTVLPSNGYEPCVVTWTGLPPGAYKSSHPYLTDPTLEAGTYNNFPVLVDTGESCALAVDAYGQSVTLSAVSFTHAALSVGANALSGSTQNYAWGQFTAPVAGAYQFTLSGVPGCVLAVSTTSALCVRDYRKAGSPWAAKEFTATAIQSDPPTSSVYVGLRTYIVGSSPTGAWAGHSGDIARGVLAAGPIQWEFVTPTPGCIATIGSSRCVFQDGAWVTADLSVQGSVTIDLEAGQTAYVRVGARSALGDQATLPTPRQCSRDFGRSMPLTWGSPVVTVAANPG